MLKFFNDNFGRYLTGQTDSPATDAQRALSIGHRMRKGGLPQRIASGWAIVRPGRPTMQFELACDDIDYSKQTRYEAFQAEFISQIVRNSRKRLNVAIFELDWCHANSVG